MPNERKKISIKVREATRKDIPGLVSLNKAAYPQLAEENVVWGEAHLLSHQRVFPRGQLVVEYKGRIVGAAASLIVTMGAAPLRNHTWSGITDSGFFSNHDPNGDTLYGADVCTHPEYRGLGVGAALYEARRQLCRKLNLRRILAGGRLWNYEEYAERFSAAEYAQRVAAGEIKEKRKRDPYFAFACAKHATSCAAALAVDGELVGLGAGRPDPGRAVELALREAGVRAEGAAMALDGPVAAGEVTLISEAARVGVTTVLIPTGEADEALAAAAREAGVVLLIAPLGHLR